MSEAFGDVDLQKVMFDGERLRSNVIERVTAAEAVRTIDGADTFTLSLRDPIRELLRSGMFAHRVTTQVDRMSFELVGVRKSGPELQVTFEDLVASALRRHDQPRKIGAGTMSRTDFVRSLVAEEPWVRFVSAPVPPEPVRIELSRGTPAVPAAAGADPSTATPEEREDSWTATGRIADEVGWRRFSRYPEFHYLPETFMFLGDPEYVLREGRNGVDSIDFDLDMGKPIARMTVTVRARMWEIPPGTVVLVEDEGPGDGKWLVSGIRRSLFNTLASVDLVQPRPTIPEPVAPASPSDVELGAEGEEFMVDLDAEAEAAAAGRAEHEGGSNFYWPCTGTITSGFGMRNGRMHEGLDIGVQVGTTVRAAEGGTVIAAEGGHGGYGNAIYIRHTGNFFTRYGHLSRIVCRRGQWVDRLAVIGFSGGAPGAPGSGNSRGPHLHFEMRPGDKAANPLRFLPPLPTPRRVSRDVTPV